MRVLTRWQQAGESESVLAASGTIDEGLWRSTVRPTKLKLDDTWQKKFQKKLLANAEEKSLGKDQLKDEKVSER